MIDYPEKLTFLHDDKKTWLVTGVAGFIGSNILETLLTLNQKVIGLDNFATGFQKNLDMVKGIVGARSWKNFEFVVGDICKLETCLSVTNDVDIVLHQAALGSVPKSIEDPIRTHRANVDGFVNMLRASEQNGVGRFVYASSSSVYGDSDNLPQQEHITGNLLSPYAVSKKAGELYAQVFSKTYDISTIGLRYFNVFGPRQSPEGAYAAVIPRWIDRIRKGEICTINGDGLTSRDFSYVDNVVYANLLAGTASENISGLFNIALGQSTSLNQLHELISEDFKSRNSQFITQNPIYADERDGDIRHSFANISSVKETLGYEPLVGVKEGLSHAIDWYLSESD